jgi:hypothetical protein
MKYYKNGTLEDERYEEWYKVHTDDSYEWCTTGESTSENAHWMEVRGDKFSNVKVLYVAKEVSEKELFVAML